MNMHLQPSNATSSPWTELYQEERDGQPTYAFGTNGASAPATFSSEPDAAMPTHDALNSIYNHE